eukprot:TRINITY_DN20092_c0_g1_i1.p1 TRINITY_DN20092_c0_g1~~TRINITY_DN20092_c0_g1_i1.p1  ORF type:complete len:283 (+),score=72.63 TRINITY_DN20092_c0_g1_i1:45-893(+)
MRALLALACSAALVAAAAPPAFAPYYMMQFERSGTCMYRTYVSNRTETQQAIGTVYAGPAGLRVDTLTAAQSVAFETVGPEPLPPGRLTRLETNLTEYMRATTSGFEYYRADHTSNTCVAYKMDSVLPHGVYADSAFAGSGAGGTQSWSVNCPFPNMGGRGYTNMITLSAAGVPLWADHNTTGYLAEQAGAFVPPYTTRTSRTTFSGFRAGRSPALGYGGLDVDRLLAVPAACLNTALLDAGCSPAPGLCNSTSCAPGACFQCQAAAYLATPAIYSMCAPLQ